MFSYYPMLYHFLTLHTHWHLIISRYRWLKSKHPEVKLVKLVGFRSKKLVPPDGSHQPETGYRFTEVSLRRGNFSVLVECFEPFTGVAEVMPCKGHLQVGMGNLRMRGERFMKTWGILIESCIKSLGLSIADWVISIYYIWSHVTEGDGTYCIWLDNCILKMHLLYVTYTYVTVISLLCI